jgi:PAT family beta-lactamase induction signal transducer AmpG
LALFTFALSHPSSVYYIYATSHREQFGYGFGFAAFMMYLIYIAEGDSKTSHYALATGFMALELRCYQVCWWFHSDMDMVFLYLGTATIPG